MVYIDENLCTGCGLCPDECQQGALAMQGSTAVIDGALCTSCERCVEVCPAGAIISAEVVSERTPSPALAQNQEVQPVWAGASPPSLAGIGVDLPGGTSLAPKPTAISRLQIAERLLSGLLSVVALALERKQGSWVMLNAPANRGVGGRRAKSDGGGRGPGLGSSPRSGRRSKSGPHQGIGKALGNRRGPRNGQGRNSRCRGEGRNRAI